MRQMRQYNFRSHPPKHQTHSQTEQRQMILRQDVGVRAPEPGHGAAGEDGHGRPFEEEGQHGLVARFARAVDVVDAGGEVGDAEGAEDDGDPEVADCGFVFEVGVQDWEGFDEGGLPDLWAVDAGD